MNNRTATLYARIDPETKAQAESILSDLNMTASGAINLFYKQIVLHRGLPFEVKMPEFDMLNINNMSTEQLNKEIMKGIKAAEEGKVVPAKDFFAMLNREFAL